MSDVQKYGRSSFLAFVPRRLEIPARLELNDFPLNVLFAKLKYDNGKIVGGSVLYEPDLCSFRTEGDKSSMVYHNIYGGDDWLSVEYNRSDGRYYGTKTVNNALVGWATGNDWGKFFFHFTSLGLKDGEHCEFTYYD